MSPRFIVSPHLFYANTTARHLSIWKGYPGTLPMKQPAHVGGEHMSGFRHHQHAAVPKSYQSIVHARGDMPKVIGNIVRASAIPIGSAFSRASIVEHAVRLHS